MTSPLAGKTVTPRPDVLVRELHGESVLLDLDSESYFGLDEVGTRMWEALLRGPTFEAALAALADEYEVDAAQLEADLADFVGQLKDAGLVEINDR